MLPRVCRVGGKFRSSRVTEPFTHPKALPEVIYVDLLGSRSVAGESRFQQVGRA